MGGCVKSAAAQLIRPAALAPASPNEPSAISVRRFVPSELRAYTLAASDYFEGDLAAWTSISAYIPGRTSAATWEVIRAGFVFREP